MKIPKKVLKLLTSCYGSWEENDVCYKCPLCIVCRTYAEYIIFDNLANLLMREKQAMKKQGVLHHRDAKEEAEALEFYAHEITDKLLHSEKECQKSIEGTYTIDDDEELWSMMMASHVDLGICEKCSESQGENPSCIIFHYIVKWEGFKEQIRPDNLPFRETSFDEDNFSKWCPYYLEHLLSKKGQ